MVPLFSATWEREVLISFKLINDFVTGTFLAKQCRQNSSPLNSVSCYEYSPHMHKQRKVK